MNAWRTILRTNGGNKLLCGSNRLLVSPLHNPAIKDAIYQLQ